jgi:adenylylsulfate kinase
VRHKFLFLPSFMGTHGHNIFPIHDKQLNRSSKEQLLGQRAKVLWFTGLSGSGKSTIAIGVENELHAMGRLTMLLDGDNVRAGINKNLGFSEDDRKENIRRIAEVATLFMDAGVITLCSFVSPTHELRESARAIIGQDDFIEIYVNTPIEICEQRDVKGLYAKARKGEIKDFTGVNAPFEEPVNPEITLSAGNMTGEECVKMVLENIMPKISYAKSG